jgi:hypothetical protein
MELFIGFSFYQKKFNAKIGCALFDQWDITMNVLTQCS